MMYVFLLLLLLVESYAFILVKTLFRSKKITIIYSILTVLFLGIMSFEILSFDRSVGQTQTSLTVMTIVLVYLITKLFLTIPQVVMDLFRVLLWIIRGIGFKGVFIRRTTTIAWVSVCFAAVPFLYMMYGVLWGKYNYTPTHTVVESKAIPDGFDGIKILQISDIHAGSLEVEKVRKAVDLINNQDFDLLVFTGDLVNNFASEVDPLLVELNRIKTPRYGKFSILGNHDYGEYIQWKSPEDKAKNFDELVRTHAKIGFRLLRNEQVWLTNGKDSLALLGVENWGHRFQKAGDITKAIKGVSPDKFKILLSHDPSHFEMEIKDYPNPIQLTLSGHTHGMQFGIELGQNIKWSPVQYISPRWAGLYREEDRYLYVNRGFGFHAFSGRIGIWPEISVIELKK